MAVNSLAGRDLNSPKHKTDRKRSASRSITSEKDEERSSGYGCSIYLLPLPSSAQPLSPPPPSCPTTATTSPLFSSIYHQHNKQQLLTPFSRRTTTLHSTPFRHSKKLTFAPPVPSSEHPFTRFYCTGALSSGEVLETAKSHSVETLGSGKGEKVKEFRKRLSTAEIKCGDDRGLGRLGQTLEVNDGSCLSNIQCVLSSGVEGYDQVEPGFVLTGASISVLGVVVESRGSKQKVELKVDKIVLCGKSDPSLPIQKNGVTREFLRLQESGIHWPLQHTSSSKRMVLFGYQVRSLRLRTVKELVNSFV